MEILESSFNDPYNYYNEPIHITFKYRIPGFAIVTDQEIIFTPVVASNIFKRAQAHLAIPTDLEERKFDFRDRCSRDVTLKETIELPTYKDGIYIPKNNELDGTGASFKGEYTIEENKLILNENIKIKKRVFKAEEWENYKSVIEAQNKFAKEKVILSR
jgi:hypothetical protein